MTVMGVFCLIIAVGVVVISLFSRRDEDILAVRGVKVHGTVLSHERARDTSMEQNAGRRIYDHYLYVSYFDQVPDKRFPVSESVYNRVRDHQTVEVTYDPENPRHAQLTDSGLGGSSTGFMVACGVVLLGLCFIGYGWKLRRDAANEVPDLDEALMLARRGGGR